MNDSTMHEQVSALADGQLRGAQLAQTVSDVCAREDLRARWHSYHLIGDVLRSGRHVPCADTATFVERLQQRLAAEAPIATETQGAVQPHAGQVRIEAANEPVFRWKLVAGMASLAAVVAIGWNLAGSPVAGGGAQLAVQQQQQPAGVVGDAPVVATSGTTPRAPASTRVVVGSGGAPQVMLRDPRLDAMLAAHQQAGGASQMPSGFLRNATFEGPSR